MLRAGGLPRAIRGVFEWRDGVGSGMHVGYAGRGLVRAQQDVVEIGVPVAGASDGVGGNFAEVTCGNEVVERLRACGLIQRVLLNGVAHGLQVLLEYRLPSANDGFFVTARGDADQHQDDGDHHHQLEHGEAAAVFAAAATHSSASCEMEVHAYQSEYLLPSSAVLVDKEKTSKTFLPPQLVESGSSCTERLPHSAFPVMGSTGICLRKRTCRIRSWPRFELLLP